MQGDKCQTGRYHGPFKHGTTGNRECSPQPISENALASLLLNTQSDPKQERQFLRVVFLIALTALLSNLVLSLIFLDFFDFSVTLFDC